MIKAYVNNKPYTATRELYVYKETPDGVWYLCPDGEDVVFQLHPPNEEGKPLLVFSRNYETSGVPLLEVLQAIVEEAANHAVFPEASHRDKIKAEAIAEERQKTLDLERGRIDVLVGTLLGHNFTHFRKKNG